MTILSRFILLMLLLLVWRAIFSQLFMASASPDEVPVTAVGVVEPIDSTGVVSPPLPKPTQFVTSTPIPAPTPTPLVPLDTLVLGIVGRIDSLNPLFDLNPTLAQISPLLYRPFIPIDSHSARPLVLFEYVEQSQFSGYVFFDSDYANKIGLEAAQWPELTSLQTVDLIQNNRLTLTLDQPNCHLIDTLAQVPIVTQFGQTISDSSSIASSPLLNPPEGEIGILSPSLGESGKLNLTPSPPVSQPNLAASNNPSLNLETSWPRGGGPFRVQAWQDDYLYLRANEIADPPSLPYLALRFFETLASAETALAAGEVDILPTSRVSSSWPEEYQRLTYQAPYLTFATFNNHDPILGQRTIRHALSLAVDRERILKQVYSGEGTLAASILPPTHWAAHPSLLIPSYDPDQAKAMLDEANLVDTDGDGWRNLPDSGQNWQVSLRVREDDVSLQNVALLLADDYRQIGVQARVEMLPLFLLLDRLLAYEYQVIVYTWLVRPELDHLIRWHSEFGVFDKQGDFGLGLNLAGYANEEVDTWLEQAHRLPNCNLDLRAKLYHQIQAQLAQDRPFDFLIFPKHFMIIRADIQGLRPGPFVPFTWNAGEWKIGSRE